MKEQISRMERKEKYCTSEWLTEHYINQQLSKSECAELIGVSYQTIHKWLRQYNIPERSQEEQRKIEFDRMMSRITKDILEEYYTNKLLSIEQCSLKLKVSPGKTKKLLEVYGIPIIDIHKERSKRYKPRTCGEYTRWRNEVFRRDNLSCVCCGTKEKIQTHHLFNFSDNKELRMQIDNGVTVCLKCHKEFHRLYGRRKTTLEQFNWFMESIGKKPVRENIQLCI